MSSDFCTLEVDRYASSTEQGKMAIFGGYNYLQLVAKYNNCLVSARCNLPCEQRLHFHGMSWRVKSRGYFSHASS